MCVYTLALTGFSKDSGNLFLYFYCIAFFFLYHLEVGALLNAITPLWLIKHEGVWRYNVTVASLPPSWLAACCDFLFVKEFCPIPPVGWPGLSDFPLVQWLSVPVRHWAVRDDTARQDLSNIRFFLSFCRSSLLPGVCFYSFFPFLRHTHRTGSETHANKIQIIDEI